jgi:hypothetical protein
MLMNTKVFLAGLAGGVAAFFLGWLLWGILAMDFMMANTTQYEGLMKEMPDMLPLILGNLIWGLFMAYIFHRWASISTFTGGLVGGLVIALPISIMFDLYFLAGMNLYNVQALVVDVLMNTVVGVVVGGVVGWVLGTGKKPEAKTAS